MTNEKPAYLDESLGFEERVKDLVSRMTLEEKASQMLYNSPAIPRLGIPSYNWWNEALHGVARAGIATVFPQAIGMAATFDEELIFDIADVISTEGRAKYHEFQRKGDHDIYKGLTFWSPNINIFRDPRWGRGHETYGEDPYLTSRLGIKFVAGLQGSDEKYLKTAACAKHFAVHSGPEGERHSFNAVASKKDMYETYLPAFKKLVQDAKVEAVMGAYNRTNGEPCCGSKTLLKDILRDDWGFKGHVTSDCWAIKDFHEYHMVTKTAPESVALAVNNGCDTNCGNMYLNLMIAYNEGLVTEEKIDESVSRLMMTRMKLGMFDKDENVPFADTSYDLVDCKEHRELALKASKESLVLLKNADLLPLKKDALKSIAVIGPNADSREALMGNYYGTPSQYITVLDGIREILPDSVRINYSQGCHLYKDKAEGLAQPNDRIAEAVAAAEKSDVVVLCLGLDATIEGEEGDAGNEYGAGDKFDLNLPGLQQQLLEAVTAAGKPVILILLSGSALAVTWADENVSAIVQAWYPGAQGGRAIAQMLFGDFSPCGKLPVTFYRTTEELPDFRDYSMMNRTYKYMQNEALYPFGFGLGYTKFEFSDLALSSAHIKSGDSITCTVKVKNVGDIESKEVVQVYLKDVETSTVAPKWQLRGVQKVSLKPGEQKQISFTLIAEDMMVVTDDGELVLEPGIFELYVGGSQPDARSIRLTGTQVLKGNFELV